MGIIDTDAGVMVVAPVHGGGVLPGAHSPPPTCLPPGGVLLAVLVIVAGGVALTLATI